MNYLDRLVSSTRERVEEKKRTIPVALLKASQACEAPTLPLSDALRGDGVSVIAEIKKASPSKGLIRRDFDVVDIARQYKLGGASAVSVLTEPTRFLGSLDCLSTARQFVDVPILRKDFIIDLYQLYEARAFGADAVLLLASLFEREELSEMCRAAHELDLSCLVEVHNAAELERVDYDLVDVLGINNRDLDTFDVDLRTTFELIPSVPDGTVIVSESGFFDAADIAEVVRAGANAVLIGESLMRSDVPGNMLRRLISEANILLRRNPALRLVV